GEALASIASVSRLELLTRHTSEDVGGRLSSRGGELETVEPAAARHGTTLKIEDLFYSVPARKKHVRSERVENARIYREIVKAALARPDVRFTYYRDEREFLLLPPRTTLIDRIADIYDTRLRDRLLTVDAELNSFRLTGFITDPQYYRSSRDAQYLFVNGRPVDFRHASFLVKKAYGELLPHGAQPCYFLFLSVDPAHVDVNVHPAKREVRMLDESGLHTLFLRAVHQTLHPKGTLSLSASADTAGPGPASVSLSLTFPRRSTSFGAQSDAAHPDSSDGSLTDGSESVHEGERADTSGLLAPVLTKSTDEELARAEEAAGQASSLPDLESLRQLGVVFGTYIIAEGTDGLFLIDQHTAHERVNYERIRGRLEKARRERQPLLTPFTVECGPDELQEILSHRETL
ncbi:MAG: hypothetical protein HY042_05330, partial [Spirochaetia bacterium]|nr:hypothetical protein [Spirochaetia bacterium]